MSNEIEGLDEEYQEEIQSRMKNPLKVNFSDLDSVNLESYTFHKTAFALLKSVRLGLNAIDRMAVARELDQQTTDLARSEFLNTLTNGASPEQGRLGPALAEKGQEVIESIAAYAVNEAQNEMEELQNQTE